MTFKDPEKKKEYQREYARKQKELKKALEKEPKELIKDSSEGSIIEYKDIKQPRLTIEKPKMLKNEDDEEKILNEYIEKMVNQGIKDKLSENSRGLNYLEYDEESEDETEDETEEEEIKHKLKKKTKKNKKEDDFFFVRHREKIEGLLWKMGEGFLKISCPLLIPYLLRPFLPSQVPGVRPPISFPPRPINGSSQNSNSQQTNISQTQPNLMNYTLNPA